MSSLDALRDLFPEAAKDTRLNLDSVLRSTSSLTPDQRWLVALSAAYAVKCRPLVAALLAEMSGVSDGVKDDAQAAATLMAMNNVFYRFRHLVGKEVYGTKRAGLRMNRLGQVATNKADFELACLAVSAINGCESCVRSHEVNVLAAGLTEDQVHDAIRVASVVTASATAFEMRAD
jgi:alkyl hydroperoxide reductase subunit D